MVQPGVEGPETLVHPGEHPLQGGIYIEQSIEVYSRVQRRVLS